MNKFFIVLVLVFFVGVGIAAANTSTSATTTSTTSSVSTTTTASPAVTSLSELNSLLSQMKTLREKIMAIMIQELSTVQTQPERVALLQSMLSQEKDIYPEGVVSGTMGNLTKQAVVRYIKKNSLRVGSSTDNILRGPARLMMEGAGNSGKIPKGIQTAPGINKKLNTEAASSSSSDGGIKKVFKKLFR